jgi:hypothetical protein
MQDTRSGRRQLGHYLTAEGVRDQQWRCRQLDRVEPAVQVARQADDVESASRPLAPAGAGQIGNQHQKALREQRRGGHHVAARHHQAVDEHHRRQRAPLASAAFEMVEPQPFEAQPAARERFRRRVHGG